MCVHMKNIVHGHCVKGIKGEPVHVNKLEKFVNLWARENNISYKYKIEETNNIKIVANNLFFIFLSPDLLNFYKHFN